MYSSGPSFEFETENPDNNDDVRAKTVSNSFKKDVPSINEGETLKRCGYDANGRRWDWSRSCWGTGRFFWTKEIIWNRKGLWREVDSNV